MKTAKRMLAFLLAVVLTASFLPQLTLTSYAASSSNVQTVYDFVTGTMGVNSAAACGILANIECESSFNPHASYTEADGSLSYGICQWNKERLTALKSFCSSRGYDYTSLTGQLYYLKSELEGSESSAYAKIRNVENSANGAYTAGYNWARYFERCAQEWNGVNQYEKRGNLARDKYWPTYGNIPEHTCNTNGSYAFYEADHPHYNCYYCSVCGKATRNYNEPNVLDDCEECHPTHTCNTNGGYAFYESYHPHYNCYYCSICGKPTRNYNEPNILDDCEECHPAEHTCNTNGDYAFYESYHPHYNCYYCSICGKPTRNYNEPNVLDDCEECHPDKPSVADTIDCYRKVQLPARKVNLYWNPTDTSPATYFDYGPTIRSSTYAKMTDGSIMYKADVNHQGTDTQMWFKYESDMQVTVYHTYGSVQYEYDHPHKAYKTCACGNTSYTGDYGTRDDCTSCRLLDSGNCGDQGDNVTWTLDRNGTLTISGSGAMEYPYYPSWIDHSKVIKAVKVTNGVTNIGVRAFADCNNLTQVTFSDSVTCIGEYAFSGCTSLTNIAIPSNITEIGPGAFSNCTNLTNVTIADGVISIGGVAFSGCTALTNITIPSSITEIGWGAFSDCTNLVSVTIENGVTKIGGTAFCDCTSLQNIVIPSSITEIEFRTFSGCTALTRVTIPDGVTTIGESAFEGCTGLTSVTISDSVTKISSAFASCSSLTSISIPSGVSYIDNNAFIHCDSLNTIEVASDNVNYSSWDGVLFNKQRTILHCYPAGRSGKYVIPNGVTQIWLGAFWRCHGLTSVIIPDSVTTIGQYAFFDCSSLLDITILNPNCTIGDEYPVEDLPMLGEPNYTTVYGYSGSTAQAYAATHGYAFSALDQDPENPPEPTQNPFTDVSVNAYYYTPVLWAVSNEITSGTSATTFSPDAGCTRAQVVAFLWRAAGKPEPKQGSNPFTDVRDGQYYYKAVLWAVEHGITAGTSATTFSPDATCTRGQIVSFLWRYEGKPGANGRGPFTDVKPGAYYEPAVLWAVANGVTAGTSATTFSPDATCTRAQVVSFLYRDLAK